MIKRPNNCDNEAFLKLITTREDHYIALLRTLYPFGLNQKFNSKDYDKSLPTDAHFIQIEYAKRDIRQRGKRLNRTARVADFSPNKFTEERRRLTGKDRQCLYRTRVNGLCKKELLSLQNWLHENTLALQKENKLIRPPFRNVIFSQKTNK